MAIAKDLLQANNERLLNDYDANIQNIRELQATLITEILPSLTDELELTPEAVDWAKEWLEDTNTLLRIARRHKFTRSFALESIRKTLIWRFCNLWHLAPVPANSALHCLPSQATDPFGRPILVVQTGNVVDVDDIQSIMLQTMESLRENLQRLNVNRDPSKPILQYIILLDLDGMSLTSVKKEVITWALREAIPRFPGMLAGVFMLNFSWVHSGLWNVIKRLLPASALSRVFFPSNEELVGFLSSSNLPSDYGGSLPNLASLDDPLQVVHSQQREQSWRLSSPPEKPQLPRSPIFTSLAPTSLLNPFFGYPASSSSEGTLTLPHGRRRKRDLARTLALLFWLKWGKTMAVVICVAVGGVVIRKVTGITGRKTYEVFMRTVMPRSWRAYNRRS